MGICSSCTSAPSAEAQPDESTAQPEKATRGGDPVTEEAKAEEPAPPAVETVKNFTLALHSASLARSFAKFGWMNPYAIITVDSKEVGRTSPDTWAHKEPCWESAYTWSSKGVPDSIQIAIWDKNNFHKDVFCGAVTVPCDADMGSQEQRNFTITKRSQPTGIVRLSLSVEIAGGLAPAMVKMPTLGLEIDHMMCWADGKSQLGVELTEAGNHGGAEAAAELDQEPPPKLKKKPSLVVVSDTGGQLTPLLGSWKCVSTHGLDEFLKATGVGMFQRKLAKAAKWPAWEYSFDGEQLLFVNHSAIGDLREEIPIGQEYNWKDGHGNPLTCKAVWEVTADGGVLLTTRCGSIGDYKEERKVIGNRLEFTLTHGTGVSWGRAFEREI
mmetsp:Transcript_56572/g.131850  ORF Transcript_56572/g.131850 Transcript_56572/m.131850 type:complete len:383 (-) Transcript_56572:63-1211(-)